MQRDRRDRRVARQHVGQREARVVALLVPAAGEALGGREAAGQVVRRLHGDEGARAFFRVPGSGRWFEGFRHDVQIVARGFGVLDGLLRGGLGVGGTGVGAGAAPGALPCREDAVDHVEPVEEGVDDEHERVEPGFVAPQFDAEVEHEEPVEAEGDGDEADGEVGDFLFRRDEGEDHDEEEEGGGADGVLHEAHDAEERVALPEADVGEHADFVGDEAEEPAPTLFEETFVGLHGFRFAEGAGAELDLIALFGANHEEVGQPPVFAEMAFAVVEEIVALFCFVGEVVFGHFAEGGESKHGESSR